MLQWLVACVADLRRTHYTGAGREDGQVGKLVGVTGFEPATPASRTQYSTRLSYTPNRTGANAQRGALRELLVITLDREGRQF